MVLEEVLGTKLLSDPIALAILQSSQALLLEWAACSQGLLDIVP